MIEFRFFSNVSLFLFKTDVCINLSLDTIKKKSLEVWNPIQSLF